MKHYCIKYTNAGAGETRIIDRVDADDAFTDLIDILDNVSNYDIECWIKNR